MSGPMTGAARGRAARLAVRLAAIAAVLLALVAAGWFVSGALGLRPVTAGDGWRLAAATHVNPRPDTWPGTPEGQVFASRTAAASAWRDYGAPGALDLAPDQALVRVTTYGSGSCPLFLAGLSIESDTVNVRLSRGLVGACTSDAVPQTFLIVIDRDRLPALPLRLVVDAPDAAGEITVDHLQ